MKKLVSSIIFLAIASLAIAQGGAQIFAGLTTMTNGSSVITGTGEFHSGYTIGLQSRLKDGSFVAGPGLKYTRFTMVSSSESAFFNKKENYHLISVPFNIGLEYRLSHLFKLRLYTGADAHYFYKIDENNRDINFDYVNDYFFGAHAGVGVDVYWMTMDINYEYGLSNAHKMDGSKYNGLTFSLGFFF